jgi:ethanolamine ammonia-lyase small subunit
VDNGSREENASKKDSNMKTPAPPSRSLSDLRELTPARVGLGRAGASMPTDALLAFTLDHARARDAVHGAFDMSGLAEGLTGFGLKPVSVSSQARNRRDYLRRPDLGRMLDPASQRAPADRSGGPCQLVIVIGDGLSPAAVNIHAIELVRNLAPRLAEAGIEIGGSVVAAGARVALGDEIGAMLGARMVLMLIGERPGLSAPDSLGAYLTFGPRIGLTDAMRNCVSNIHGAGLSYDEAAFKIAWLVREGLARQITGVALKDESGGPPAQIGSRQSQCDKSET